jgi:molybdate transport system substrate-binding protein
MKRRYSVLFVATTLATLSSACTQPEGKSSKPAPASETLTVSAAISLRKPLEEVQQLYQRNHPGARITYNFGSSGSLQQQIEQGVPVDLFISAGTKQMNALQQKHLLQPGSQKPLLTNQLVLITSKNNSALNSVNDLTRANRIALGEPKSVPAGQYAEEALKYYQMFDQVRSQLIYGKDVRQVLTYVETGNVDAGFVYLTDAKASDQVKIVAMIPSEAHQPILYPIAQLERSKRQEAQDFANFLTSDAAMNVFKQYGFSTPNLATKP